MTKEYVFKWRSAGKPPKKQGKYYVFVVYVVRGKHGTFQAIAEYFPDSNTWSETGVNSVTHWAELPPDPVNGL